MNISRKKRERIFDKTCGTCWYCGIMLRDGWHVEHMLPIRRGGTSHIDNLVPACRYCNTRKGNRDVDEFRERVTDQIATHIHWAVYRINKAYCMLEDLDAIEEAEDHLKQALKIIENASVKFFAEMVNEFDLDLAWWIEENERRNDPEFTKIGFHPGCRPKDVDE